MKDSLVKKGKIFLLFSGADDSDNSGPLRARNLLVTVKDAKT